MDMVVIPQLISQIGFPIFMAIYLIVRLDKSIAHIGEEIKNLTLILIELKLLIRNVKYDRQEEKRI